MGSSAKVGTFQVIGVIVVLGVVAAIIAMVVLSEKNTSSSAGASISGSSTTAPGRNLTVVSDTLKPSIYGNPLPPAQKLGYKPIRLPIRKTLTMESHFESRLPMLVAQIEDQPASLWLLDSQLEQSVGPKSNVSIFRLFSLDGHVLEFGPISLKQRDLSDMPIQVQGILGVDFMKQLLVEIDWVNSNITFSPKTLRPSGMQLEIIDDTLPIVQGQFGTFPEGRWAIDTSAQQSSLDATFARKYELEPAPDSFTISTQTGVQPGAPIIGMLKFAKGMLRTIPQPLGMAPLQDVQGILGTDIMQTWAVAFDFARKKVAIKY